MVRGWGGCVRVWPGCGQARSVCCLGWRRPCPPPPSILHCLGLQKQQASLCSCGRAPGHCWHLLKSISQPQCLGRRTFPWALAPDATYGVVSGKVLPSVWQGQAQCGCVMWKRCGGVKQALPSLVSDVFHRDYILGKKIVPISSWWQSVCKACPSSLLCTPSSCLPVLFGLL